MQEEKQLKTFNILWNEDREKREFNLAVFLVVIGVIGLFVSTLCAEILRIELKKCTPKKNRRQLRRSKCCQDLSQQRQHLKAQEMIFTIPIKKENISNLRETGIQMPPSYQECGNENEKKQPIPLTD